MARKLLPGVMVALIVILSLFGSVGTSFAANAVGGPSLSKWVYAEKGEMVHQTAGTDMNLTEEQLWAGIDTFLDGYIFASSTFDIWHIFSRNTFYTTDGGISGSRDIHYFAKVPKSANAKWLRQGGKIYFQNQKTFDLVPYQYITLTKTQAPQWVTLTPTGQGISAVNSALEGNTVVFELMSTQYDPKNPPPYGVPGNTDSNSSFPDVPIGGGGGTTNPDPNFPSQPTPPDNNWDLIGWVKYIVDWLIYLVKCFVYFLKSFGTAIADVVTGSASLISAMTDFFAFLPNQVTTIIGMGIVAMIIVGVVKR